MGLPDGERTEPAVEKMDGFSSVPVQDTKSQNPQNAGFTTKSPLRVKENDHEENQETACSFAQRPDVRIADGVCLCGG